MTKASKGIRKRGICTWCNGEFPLRQDGTVWLHQPKTFLRRPTDPKITTCPGSAEEPERKVARR